MLFRTFRGKRDLAFIVLGALSIFGHPLATPAQSEPRALTEDAVRAAELARGEALTRADTVALSRMVAAEFVEISRFGALRTRQQNLTEIASGRLKLSTVKYDSLQVRIYGNTAVLTGIAENAGVYGGMPFTGRIRYTRVFVFRDDRWQAVAMQQTSIP
jgi:hypothetical protein